MLLRQQRAAEVLDVSESAVRRLVKKGALRTVKVNGATRVRVADLKAYVEALAVADASDPPETAA